MKRIKTLETRSLCESAKKGGCGPLPVRLQDLLRRRQPEVRAEVNSRSAAR